MNGSERKRWWNMAKTWPEKVWQYQCMCASPSVYAYIHECILFIILYIHIYVYIHTHTHKKAADSFKYAFIVSDGRFSLYLSFISDQLVVIEREYSQFIIYHLHKVIPVDELLSTVVNIFFKDLTKDRESCLRKSSLDRTCSLESGFSTLDQFIFS